MSFVARAAPIYMIGDSHCLVFNDLVFERGGRHFVTHAKHCPGLDARDFVDARGSLNPMVFESLRGERLIRPEGDRWKASHLTKSPVAQSAAELAELDRSAPPIVIIVGSGDLYYFVKGLAPGSDFPLEGLQFTESDFEEMPVTSVLPWKPAVESAAAMLGPLFRGLRLLERAGFSRMFLHALPPQTVDDAEYQRLTGMHVPVRVRYKATLLFNALFREFARQNPAIGFIDTWDATTAGGKLAPGFLLDHWHLNKEAAYLTVEALLDELLGVPRVPQRTPENPNLSHAVKEVSGETEMPAVLVESEVPLAELTERLMDLCVELRDEKGRVEAELLSVTEAAEERAVLLELNETKFRQLSESRAALQKIAEERLAEILSLTKTAEERLKAMLAFKADAEHLRALRKNKNRRTFGVRRCVSLA